MPSETKFELHLRESDKLCKALASRVDSQSANLRAGERDRVAMAKDISGLKTEVAAMRRALCEIMEAVHGLEYRRRPQTSSAIGERLAG